MVTPTPLNSDTTEFVPTTGVLLITNSEQSPDSSYGFTLALTLAAKGDVPITLYDRSEETWGDSQHPEGPLQLGDDRLTERSELSAQLTWIDDHGIVGQGWVATLPSISAALTALAQVKADAVVVPQSLGRNLFERALEGGSLAESIAEQVSRNNEIDATVFEISDDGTARRVTV